MNEFDVVVLGQGLAGTTLAWRLRERGQRVLVIDRDAKGGSSKIAAGLMTPITGRRLVKTWHWEIFWPAACEFYRRAEAELNAEFFYPRRMVRLLADESEKDYLDRRIASEFSGLVQQPQPLVNLDWFEEGLGGFEMLAGGRLNVAAFLQASRDRFADDGMLLTAEIDVKQDVVVTADGVQLPRFGISARRAVFCQGIDAVQNPWFAHVRFKPAKGEILTVRIEGLPEERIIHRGVWLMPLAVRGKRGQPLSGQAISESNRLASKGSDPFCHGLQTDGLFRVGATYEWNDLNDIPTTVGREEICSRLRDFLRLPFEVVAHDAAVRPIVLHQYPVVGMHPDFPHLGFFNGLGSKGSLQAPWLANHLAESLCSGQPIDPDVGMRHYDAHLRQTAERGSS
ncbi:MAG: FAD-binding oxidoreductase [Planctomycetaceae bacterium]